MTETLKKLIDGLERTGFYGELVIKFEDGKAIRVEKTEKIKL